MRNHDQVSGRDRSPSGEVIQIDEPDSPEADTDEAAASQARARFRSSGLEPVEADDRVRPVLAPGEQVIAVRHGVALDRRVASSRASAVDSIRGDLYVTTARIVHIGDKVNTFPLDQIEDSALAGESVLLILHDGVGIVLDADRPRLLRVQIAAARAGRIGRAEGPAEPLQPSSR